MPRRTASKIPTEDVLAAALAGVVRDWFEAGEVDNITVNRVRSEVESLHKLPSGYLKNDEAWNKRSKAIIHDEFEGQQAQAEDDKVEDRKVPTRSPIIPSKQSKKTAQNSVSVVKSKSSGRKRKRAEPELAKDEPTKESVERGSSASEVSLVPENGDDADEGGSKASGEDEPSQFREKTSKSQVEKEVLAKEDMKDEDESDDDTSKVRSQEDRVNGDAPKPLNGVEDEDTKAPLSESEMSVLIDEEPPPKKGRRKPSSEPKSKKNAKPKKTKAPDDSSLDPQEAEIKRLQSQLLKCGIRKLWHKELARFDTPRAKLNYLRAMLKEIGMVGRFSVEKARQIKEERELRAEVQAVQDSAKRWGEMESDDEDEDEGGEGEGSPPHRKMAKGLKGLEFLGDDDGAETD